MDFYDWLDNLKSTPHIDNYDTEHFIEVMDNIVGAIWGVEKFIDACEFYLTPSISAAVRIGIEEDENEDYSNAPNVDDVDVSLNIFDRTIIFDTALPKNNALWWGELPWKHSPKAKSFEESAKILCELADELAKCASVEDVVPNDEWLFY